LELQSGLLRVVEDGEFERLGNSHTIKADARIIAATNRDLEEEVNRGNFRKDLYYRLDAFLSPSPLFGSEPMTSPCWSIL
jgi:chemotaxis protein methyltransferase CheR